MIGYENGSSIETVIAGGNGCGSNNNQLCTPYGLVDDTISNVFIASTLTIHTIVRWSIDSSNGTTLIGTRGASGSSPIRFSMPSGICLDSMGNLYVADRKNHRIELILVGQNHTYKIAGFSGVSGNALNLLNGSIWIVLDAQLNLYITDSNNHRVMKFMRY